MTNSRTFTLADARAGKLSKEERAKLHQVMEQIIEVMKPTLDEWNNAEIEASDYIHATHPDVKTLEEITAYQTAKPLSQLAAAMVRGGIFESGRPKGSKSPKTLYIENLVADYPVMSAKELFAKSDKKIIGDMKFDTFKNKVSLVKTNK